MSQEIRKWLIIKDNYVINAIIWDGITPYQYPEPYDRMIEDVEQAINIGMWYEETENLFYNPTGVPIDWPIELLSMGSPYPLLYNGVWIHPLNGVEHLFLKSILPHTILHFNDEYQVMKYQEDFEQGDKFDPEYGIPIYSYLASETLNKKIVKTYHYQNQDGWFTQTGVDYDLMTYTGEVTSTRAKVNM
jgi:hypothetical protein